MTGESHVEQQVAARIAAAKRKEEAAGERCEEFARARRAGLGRRHAQKLYNLAQRGLDLAPPSFLDNTTPAASGC